MNEFCLRTVELAIAARVPVLLWGAPGTGKTSAVQGLGTQLGLPCEVVIASIREPSDFAGLPVIREHGVDMAPPRWAQRLADRPGLLFLDELSTAPPAVQAAVLRVVLERHVGDLRLHDDVAVVAAANPPDVAADGWDLAPPLANRFAHVDWPVDVGVWVDGVVGGFRTTTRAVPSAGEINANLTAATALVAAFVRHRPNLLLQQPSSLEQAGRAWPSPRTWSMASRLIAAARSAEASEELVARLVTAAVGPGAAAEFISWQRELDLPDPVQTLADPTSFEVPERGDRAYAAMTSLVAAALADGSERAWSSAWVALAHATRHRHADLSVIAVRTLIRHRPDGAMPPAESLRQMAPVLREAGLFDALAGS